MIPFYSLNQWLIFGFGWKLSLQYVVIVVSGVIRPNQIDTVWRKWDGPGELIIFLNKCWMIRVYHLMSSSTNISREFHCVSQHINSEKSHRQGHQSWQTYSRYQMKWFHYKISAITDRMDELQNYFVGPLNRPKMT